MTTDRPIRYGDCQEIDEKLDEIFAEQPDNWAYALLKKSNDIVRDMDLMSKICKKYKAKKIAG